ncbi:MAG TPA: hypothetical protein VFE94_03410, partial [Candidatus Paceibacterota bacterium]|nr:hypothetical protein [Candidatus Paceibacterota bacterium]
CQDGTCDSEEAGSGTSPGNTADRTTYCLSTSGNGGAQAAKDTAGNVGVAGCVVISYTPPSVSAYVALYTSGGSEVSGSEVSSTSATWTRVRSSAITLSDATDYVVRIKADSNVTAEIANAKIIFEQTDAGGIDELEPVHQYINTLATETSASYVLQDFDNEYNPSNWAGGTFAYLFEATLHGSVNPDTAAAQLYNVSDSEAIDDTAGGGDVESEVTTTNGSYERKRSLDLSGNSDWPSAAKTLDTQLNNSGGTTSTASSWLIIQVTGLAPAAVISVVVVDGAVVYGTVATSKNTTSGDLNDGQDGVNNGDTTENFNIKGQNATGGGCTWTLSDTAGSDTYVHEFSTNSGTDWLDLSTSYRQLVAGVSTSATQSFDLRITVPTPSSCFGSQTVDVTVQAVQG